MSERLNVEVVLTTSTRIRERFNDKTAGLGDSD
jgi:hypothetical protein